MAVSIAERPGLDGPASRTSLSSSEIDRRTGKPRRQVWQRRLAFLGPLGAYLTGAFLLALKYHSYFGDAQAREANAFYVFFSRDPHLASIGFVWNPGTSIAEMPLLLLKGIFPALVHEMLAAGIMSALAMAGACYHLYRFLDEEEVSTWPRWSIFACFAFNPMTLSYGADGMSEAWFCLCLVAATRYLVVWLRSRRLRPLVASALLVGVAYVVRNEAIAAAAAGTLLVLGATYIRQGSLPSAARRAAALTDAVIFVIPAFVAFASWAAVSWIIVGHPLEQYSSAYGTASQIKFLGLNQYGGGKVEHFEYVVRAIWLLAPLLPLSLLVGGYGAWRRRNPSLLGVIAILGAVCTFEIAAYSTGQISWALRYVIYAIPMSAMVAGCLASPCGRHVGDWRLAVTKRFSLRMRTGGLSVIAVLLLLPGVFSTENTELHSNIDPVDQQIFQWILFPHDKGSVRWTAFRHEWSSINIVARNLDAMHLKEGSIMVDTEEPCIPNLILQSTNPRQFFIPNDSDFKGKIGSPYEFGVRYLMVAAPAGYGSVDALNVEYPTLYQSGAGIATLDKTIAMSNCPVFRLYKLIPNVT